MYKIDNRASFFWKAVFISLFLGVASLYDSFNEKNISRTISGFDPNQVCFKFKISIQQLIFKGQLYFRINLNSV